MRYSSKPVGWRNESYRHYLASKRVSTTIKKKNRAQLKKWGFDKSDIDEIYTKRGTGELLGVYSENKGRGEAVSNDILKRYEVVGALTNEQARKYFANKMTAQDFEEMIEFAKERKEHLEKVKSELVGPLVRHKIFGESFNGNEEEIMRKAEIIQKKIDNLDKDIEYYGGMSLKKRIED